MISKDHTKYTTLASFCLILAGCGNANSKRYTTPEGNVAPTATVGAPPEITGFSWNKDVLPVALYYDDDLSESQLRAIEFAIGDWEIATGVNLIDIIGPDETLNKQSIEDLYSTLDDDKNSIFLFPNWSVSGKDNATLATTIWESPANSEEISQGDIFFNIDHYNFSEGDEVRTREDSRVGVDMGTVTLHELGHFLGLAHVASSVDPDSIMAPTLKVGVNASKKNLSRGDIERIQEKYGCDGSDSYCDIENAIDRLRD